MPQVLEETEVKLDRLDLRSRSPLRLPVSASGRVEQSARTKGIHLSGILWYIATESGMKKATADIEEEELPLRMALGLAWEEFAVSLYPEIDWQPGEWIEEGIAMNCDGVSEVTSFPPLLNAPWLPDTEAPHSSPCLEEFKLTWKKVKSGGELLEEEWYWVQQGRGYCWGYDARLVRWHICYVNGDYRGSGPIYKRYLVSFSDEEIRKTESMLLLNKKRAEEKGFSE